MIRIWNDKEKKMYYPKDDKYVISMNGEVLNKRMKKQENTTALASAIMCDKFGTQIYEEDIVIFGCEDNIEGMIITRGVVRMLGFGWGIASEYYHPLDTDKTPWLFSFVDIADCQCGKKECLEAEIEVIGNTYENPDLGKEILW